MNKIGSLCVAVVTAFVALSTLAADYTWNGGGDKTSWTDPANWGKVATSDYPKSSDNAIIPANAAVELTIGQDQTIKKLTVNNGVKITFKSADGRLYKFTCTDTVTLGSSVAWTVDGVYFYRAQEFTFAAGTTLTLKNGAELYMNTLKVLSKNAVTLSDRSHLSVNEFHVCDGTTVSIDDSTLVARNHSYLGGAAPGGGRMVFKGANPIFESRGGNFRSNNNNASYNTDFNFDFEIPLGGFKDVPVKVTGNNKAFDSMTSCPMKYNFNVLADAPALTAGTRLDLVLLQAQGGTIGARIGAAGADTEIATTKFDGTLTTNDGDRKLVHLTLNPGAADEQNPVACERTRFAENITTSVSRRKLTISVWATRLANTGTKTRLTCEGGLTDDPDTFTDGVSSVEVKNPGKCDIAWDSPKLTFQLCYVRLRYDILDADGNVIETTYSDIYPLTTVDNAIYTWQAVDGEWDGDLNDRAHWKCSITDPDDRYDYPQHDQASAAFPANCKARITVPESMTLGMIKLTGDGTDVVFAPAGGDKSLVLTANRVDAQTRTAESKVTFENLTVVFPVYEVNPGAYNTVIFRNCDITSSASLCARYANTRVVLEDSKANLGGLKIGGARGCFLIRNSVCRASGTVSLGDTNAGGTLRFEGENPLLFVSNGDVQANVNNNAMTLEFLVPSGGYRELPIQTVTSPGKFGLRKNGKSGVSYTFRVLPESPILKDFYIGVVPLMDWGTKGLENTLGETLRFDAGGSPSAGLRYSGSSAAAGSGFDWKTAPSAGADGTTKALGVYLVGLPDNRNQVRVTAEPAEIGTPEPGYGIVTEGIVPGERKTFAFPPFDTGDGILHSAVSWTVKTYDPTIGDYALTATGTGDSCDYEHPDPAYPSILIWNLVENYKVLATADAEGTVDPAAQWVRRGEQATVTATGDAEHDFCKWAGVPDEIKYDNPLKLTITEPTEIRATFIAKGSVERVWKGGEGFWDDPDAWKPAGVPTEVDNAVIASGTVKAKSSFKVNNLMIEAGGALYFASTGTVTEALAAWPNEPTNRVFAVAGDLTCAGSLVVGGLWTVAEKDIITNLSVTVGGNLTLTGSARAAFYAATTPSEFSWENLYAARTTVAVGGAMTIADTAILYPTCDELTGAPLCFTCESFNLAVGAKVDAQDRGWAWHDCYRNLDDVDPRQTGTSTRSRDGVNHTYFTLARHQIGSSYTAHGCYGAEENAYGYAYAPFMAGSPTGTYAVPHPGGGQFWLVARGTATVEGQVLADAITSVYGPGSGGGIWLCAKKLVSGDKALLSAQGGINWHGGAKLGGTGGRISLGLGLSATDIEHLAAGQEPTELGLNWQDLISEIPVDCSGNRGGQKDADGNYSYAPAGTMTVVYGSAADTTVTVYGDIGEFAQPEPDYGAGSYEKGSTQAFSCPAFGVAGPNERYWCVGYVVSNATEEVTRGDALTFDLAIGSDPLAVTWLWGRRQVGCTVDGVVGATVSVDGVSGGAEGVTKWLEAGEAPAVSVTPEAGYEFLCWEGPIPFGEATANPLRLPADIPFCVRPVVRPVAAPTLRIFSDSSSNTKKSWTDPTAWTPQGVPGAQDEILIAGKGTLLASNYFACATLTLAESAVFVVGGAPTEYQEEAALVVAGNLSMQGTASLTVASRNRHCRGNLTVGGDLTLANTCQLTVSAGPTNGVEFTYTTGAGFVTVGGNLTVGGTSTVIPNSEPWTGGSVVFSVGGAFTLDEKATFRANDNGFQRVPGLSPVTWGPGWGESYWQSAGYGGYGLNHGETYGKTYGSALAPIYPGSPSGDYGDHPGGGLIRVHAEGAVTLAGTLDASARANPTDASSASGGGVWVTAGGEMTVASTAVLKARGGYRCTGAGSPGGGGRIALARKLPAEKLAAMAADGDYHGPGRVNRHVLEREAFLSKYPGVVIDVNCGEADMPEECNGTFRFIDAQQKGFVLFLR